MLKFLWILLLGFGSLFGQDTRFFETMTAQFKAGQPLTLAFDGDHAAALAVQHQWLAHLEPVFGKPVGYKAALTSPAAQSKIGVTEPVLGTLLAGMLLPNGASVPAHYGAVPVVEGDLLVRVGDAAINDAVGPEALLACLDGLAPLIELPDLVFAKGTALSGPAIEAVNAGARYAVMGDVVPLKGATQASLREIHVTLKNPAGEVLAKGHSGLLLGDPLRVVAWIRDTVVGRGARLEKGQWLSLGSMTPPLPAPVTGTLRADFTGLPGGAQGSVTLTLTAESAPWSR